MLNFYKTIDNRVVPIEVPEDGSWICAISPNEEEISYLTDNLQIDPGFVRAALDEEESSRVEKEEDIQAALDEARTYTDAPTIIEFMISTDEIVLPMVKSGNPMSEMILK